MERAREQDKSGSVNRQVAVVAQPNCLARLCPLQEAAPLPGQHTCSNRTREWSCVCLFSCFALLLCLACRLRICCPRLGRLQQSWWGRGVGESERGGERGARRVRCVRVLLHTLVCQGAAGLDGLDGAKWSEGGGGRSRRDPVCRTMRCWREFRVGRGNLEFEEGEKKI